MHAACVHACMFCSMHTARTRSVRAARSLEAEVSSGTFCCGGCRGIVFCHAVCSAKTRAQAPASSTMQLWPHPARPARTSQRMAVAQAWPPDMVATVSRRSRPPRRKCLCTPPAACTAAAAAAWKLFAPRAACTARAVKKHRSWKRFIHLNFHKTKSKLKNLSQMRSILQKFSLPNTQNKSVTWAHISWIPKFLAICRDVT